MLWDGDLTPAVGPDFAELRAWWRRLVQGLLAGLVGTARAVGG